MLWLRRAFVGAATAWIVALLAAPVAAALPAPSIVGHGFALVIYAAGSLICHQRPERSFHLLGVQLPVCARCLGIYASAAVAACLLAMRTAEAAGSETDMAGSRPVGSRSYVGSAGRRMVAVARHFGPAPRTMLFLSTLPAAVTLLYEWATGNAPGNWTRAVSGAPLGAAVAWILSGLDISHGQERHE
jgi:hypothetical protein